MAIYCTIRIEVSDPHPNCTPRVWKAIVEAATQAAKMATAQHDTVTQPPLPHSAKGHTKLGDAWECEVRAGPF